MQVSVWRSAARRRRPSSPMAATPPATCGQERPPIGRPWGGGTDIPQAGNRSCPSMVRAARAESWVSRGHLVDSQNPRGRTVASRARTAGPAAHGAAACVLMPGVSQWRGAGLGRKLTCPPRRHTRQRSAVSRTRADRVPTATRGCRGATSRPRDRTPYGTHRAPTCKRNPGNFPFSRGDRRSTCTPRASGRAPSRRQRSNRASMARHDSRSTHDTAAQEARGWHPRACLRVSLSACSRSRLKPVSGCHPRRLAMARVPVGRLSDAQACDRESWRAI